MNNFTTNFKRTVSLLLTIGVFTGFVLSALVAPSWSCSAIIIISITGLVLLAIVDIRRNKPSYDGHAWSKNSGAFAALMIGTYFAGKYLSLLCHEWSHAIWANIFGVRQENIFDIHYGSNWTLNHIWAVDDGTFYQTLFAEGHDLVAGMIALGGLLTNILLAVLSIFLLLRFNLRKLIIISLLLFWSFIHNIGQIVSYIPLRTVFYDGGDIYLFCKGMNISHWLVLLIGTGFLFWAFVVVFKKIIPQLLISIEMRFPEQLCFAALSWATIFVWYGTLPVVMSVKTLANIRMTLVAGTLLAGFIVLIMVRRRLFYSRIIE